jgi:ribonuclease BN (tRNA processing enzyme)
VKITFVGTGSGKTSLNQFHSSLLISSESYNLLIDAGDGISRALLFNEINFNTVDGILITHFHPDHFSGLPSLIFQMKITDRKKPLDIFIHPSFKNFVNDFLLQSYIFPERNKYEIQYKTFINDNIVKIEKNFSFIARKNSHLSKLGKYELSYPSISFYSASLLLESESKKIIYTSDIGSVEDIFLFKEFSSDLFICEANHLEPALLVEAICKIETKKIYLTHYSENNLKNLSEILASSAPEIQSKIIITKDRLSFQI